ncbi:MAG: UDP-N-acetylmuramate dehydrogenase [Anaerolineales bacterium]|nr:UDP-N-acetylmuramate dehydrogenase [Chloroflexota bacterium]MBL6980557.1 UDP-N-acetylmuramate dehydrogenase [Anaerolineales bacterium]
MIPVTTLPLDSLRSIFGDNMQTDVPLARYTAARVGGLADVLITVNSAKELEMTAKELWAKVIPYLILGGGSNVLVSDEGVRDVVIFNRAREIRFDEDASHPAVWAESGANFGSLARRAANKGLSGLEWAAGIPGTVGGAVFGNAGAHGGDVAGCLEMAEILHQDGRKENWTTEEMDYSYRTSRLKRENLPDVILAASFSLEHSFAEEVQRQMDEFSAFRHQTQPPGASMGSMFKNPPGDYAGRLIDESGIKGTRVGQAEISPLHANFFINHGDASATDIYKLIVFARDTVSKKFDVNLELEIELAGDWNLAIGK